MVTRGNELAKPINFGISFNLNKPPSPFSSHVSYTIKIHIEQFHD